MPTDINTVGIITTLRFKNPYIVQNSPKQSTLNLLQERYNVTDFHVAITLTMLNNKIISIYIKQWHHIHNPEQKHNKNRHSARQNSMRATGGAPYKWVMSSSTLSSMGTAVRVSSVNARESSSCRASFSISPFTMPIGSVFKSCSPDVDGLDWKAQQKTTGQYCSLCYMGVGADVAFLVYPQATCTAKVKAGLVRLWQRRNIKPTRQKVRQNDFQLKRAMQDAYRACYVNEGKRWQRNSVGSTIHVTVRKNVAPSRNEL